MDLYAPLLKNILFPLYESIIKNRETMHDLQTHISNLSKTPLELKQIQFNRLIKLLNHCQSNVPYYHKMFSNLGIDNINHNIKSLSDFEKLPVLTKSIIKENNELLIASNYRGKNLVKSTGGSTGQPLRLEMNKESEARRTALMYRGYGWLGAGLGVKTFFLWGANLGASTSLKKLKLSLHESFLNRKTVSSFNMKQGNLSEYIAQINNYKPTALVSYTNPLFQLSKHIIENSLKIHSPKTIITGAEALTEYQREVIEKAFKCKVYNTYGCREVMLIGAECSEQHGFHMNTDHLVIETLNHSGQNVLNGVGDVTLTDLSNFGMPLLRYQNGDTANISNRSCSCGNPLPIMEEITGRKVDVLKTPSGGLIPGLFFPHIMKEHNEIIRYQVKQSDLSSVELNLICNKGLDYSSRQQIQNEFKKIANDVKLIIKIVDDIPLAPSGKHRNVICEI